MKIKNYKELNIWQKSIDLVQEMYKITKYFPRDELYGLSSQIRRAAVSILSNIAEGFNRFHNREFRQFLYISFGSCAEVETQKIITHRLEYIDQKSVSEILEKIKEIGKMINSLIKKINNNLN